MILNDPMVGRYLPPNFWVEGMAIGTIVGWIYWQNNRQQDRAGLATH